MQRGRTLLQGANTKKLLQLLECVQNGSLNRMQKAHIPDAEIIAKRYRQRMCELYEHPINKALSKEESSEAILGLASCCLDNGQTVDFDGGTISGGRISARLKQLFLFLGWWLLALSAIILPTVKKRHVTYQDHCTIVTSLPENLLFRDGSRRIFMEWVKSRQIDVLSDADWLFTEIRSPAYRGIEENAHFSARPILAYFAQLDLKVMQRFSFAGHHLLGLLESLMMFARLPLLLDIAEDFAFDKLLTVLRERGWHVHFLITNGDTYRQPIWQWRVVNTNLSQTHYSVVPLLNVHADDPLPDKAIQEAVTVVSARCRQYAWSEIDRRIFIEDLGFETVQNVGVPYYLQVKSVSGTSKQKRGKRIILFDSIAYDLNKRAELWGYTFQYHCAENMISFVRDVSAATAQIMVSSGLPMNMVLKRKRATRSGQSDSYQDFLDRPEQCGVEITVLIDDLEFGKLLQEADLVVAFPFSSAGFATANQNIPTIFYDPAGELAKRPGMGAAYFENSYEGLESRMRQTLNA